MGDEQDKETSTIVQMRQTMEVEHYQGIITDNEEDSNLALPNSATLEHPRIKALTQEAQEEEGQQAPPAHPIENGDVSRVKKGKFGPKKSVSFDEFPEVIEDIPLEDIDLPKSKKEKDVSPKSSKASSGKTPKEPAPEEHQGPDGEVKGVKETQRKLSRGRGSLSQDAAEGKRRGRRPTHLPQTRH